MYSYTIPFLWQPFASVTPAPEEIHWSRSDSRGGPQAARHEEEKALTSRLSVRRRLAVPLSLVAEAQYCEEYTRELRPGVRRLRIELSLGSCRPIYETMPQHYRRHRCRTQFPDTREERAGLCNEDRKKEPRRDMAQEEEERPRWKYHTRR